MCVCVCVCVRDDEERHFLQHSGGFSSMGACTSGAVSCFKPSIDLKTETKQLKHRAATKHWPFLKLYRREKKSEVVSLSKLKIPQEFCVSIFFQIFLKENVSKDVKGWLIRGASAWERLLLLFIQNSEQV